MARILTVLLLVFISGMLIEISTQLGNLLTILSLSSL